MVDFTVMGKEINNLIRSNLYAIHFMQMTLEEAIGYVASDELIEVSWAINLYSPSVDL